MIPQHTHLTFTVTPEPGWKVSKWTGVEVWEDQIGYDVENNEVHLSVTEDVTVSVTMIEEEKADTPFLQIRKMLLSWSCQCRNKKLQIAFLSPRLYGYLCLFVP